MTQFAYMKHWQERAGGDTYLPIHICSSSIRVMTLVVFLFLDYFFSAGAWTLCVCQFSAKWQSVNPGSFNSAALPVAGSRTVPQPGQLQEWTEPRAAFKTVGNVTIQHKAHEKEMVEFRFWGGYLRLPPWLLLCSRNIYKFHLLFFLKKLWWFITFQMVCLCCWTPKQEPLSAVVVVYFLLVSQV